MSSIKRFKSPSYNYMFRMEDGYFIRWGKTPQEDPEFSPYGPEIVDIEVTTSCSGPDGKVCKFCYKGNTPKGKNMDFSTFKIIFDKLPNTVTQIAFGADATLTSNSDIWSMFEYCRSNKVVPNVTVANVNDETARKLASVCGAVAVSRYENKNLCYDSVSRLSKYGLNQINIHQLLSKETFNQVKETILDAKIDPRLTDLKSIVFLSLKPKGRGVKYSPLSKEEFKEVIDISESMGISYGFDSCSANKFLQAITEKDRDQYITSVEPCESTCFSMYINVDGEYFPCSFTEDGIYNLVGDWSHGISLVDNDFMDVWGSERTKKFRASLLANVDSLGIRSCPLYTI